MAEWKYQKAIHIPDPSLPTFCWLNSSGTQGAFSWVIESINFSLRVLSTAERVEMDLRWELNNQFYPECYYCSQ